MKIVKFILLKLFAISVLLILMNGVFILVFSEVYTTNFVVPLVLGNLVIIVDKILQPLIIQKKEKTVGKKYNTIVLVVLILGIPFVFTLPYIEYSFIEKNIFPSEVIFTFWILGTLMVIIGGLILCFSRYILGKQASIVVGIERKHKLITTGPYHIIRHPIYVGSLILSTGYVLSFCSCLLAISIFLLFLKIIKARILKEEKMLIETFGDEYKEYMKRTKRLIPFIY